MNALRLRTLQFLVRAARDRVGLDRDRIELRVAFASDFAHMRLASNLRAGVNRLIRSERLGDAAPPQHQA